MGKTREPLFRLGLCVKGVDGKTGNLSSCRSLGTLYFARATYLLGVEYLRCTTVGQTTQHMYIARGMYGRGFR